MSEKPDLSRMSLKQMEALATAIDAAVDAGGALTVSGLEPTFVVCPGQEIVIRTGFTMPGMGRGLWLADTPPVTGFAPRPLVNFVPPMQTSPQTVAVAERPAAQDVAAPVAVGHTVYDIEMPAPPLSGAPMTGMGGAEPDVAAPSPTDPQPEAAPVARAGDTVTAAELAPVPGNGGEARPDHLPVADGQRRTPEAQAEGTTGEDAMPGAGGPIPDPEPTQPVPGSASALVASTQAAGWTAEEDALAVQVAAAAIHAGRTKTAAYAEAAAAVGRPVPGTTFRLTHKLVDPLRNAIAAKLADVVAEAAAPEPVSPPARLQDAAVEPAPAACRTAAGADAEVPTLDPLQAHLTSLKPSAVWSPARDLSLLQLAIDGWKPHEIAEDLGVVVAEVNRRFDLLTGYDRETKRRRFAREAVLRALQAMHRTGDA